MTPAYDKLSELLQTPRLTLRIPRVWDAASLATAVKASLPELKPWLPWATDAYGPIDAEQWIRRAAARFITAEGASYLIFAHGGSEVLGGVGAHDLQWKTRSTEIGYWLRTDCAERGYMVEAVGALTEMLQDAGLRRIQIRCDELNGRSAATARRSGYDHEGTLRWDTVDTAGKPRSTMVFARIFNVPAETAAERGASLQSASSVQSA